MTPSNIAERLSEARNCLTWRFSNTFNARADEQERYGFGAIGYGCKHPVDGGVYVLNPEKPSCLTGYVAALRAMENPMTLNPEQIAEGWIEHDGGPCPVKAWEPVHAMLRNGDTISSCSAVNLIWEHDGRADDLVAYKPEKPHD